MDHQHARPSFWNVPSASLLPWPRSSQSGDSYLVHKDHVLALLPYAFLAACPLMHVFMHRGHDGSWPHRSYCGPAGPSSPAAGPR